MFDVKQMLNQYLGNQAGTAAPNGAGQFGGLAGGALAGGLVGLLAGTKTGRRIGRHALTYGGTAVLGGLAYKAWRDWQGGRPPGTTDPAADTGSTPVPVPPADSAFLPQPGEEAAFERALLRAMIGAAKADGEIDGAERQRISDQVETMALDPQMQAFVTEELARPLDLEAIIASAKCQETAAEIYAASLLAVDSTRPAEKGYLAMLAARLKLAPGLVGHLHANLGRPTTAA